mmetsp:Transcript_42909/g.69029  ORF Transcript_42909/g.69029 Transcript_42909/m.69029 type:complete len:143 (+) Transcript_42909:804-1232(+)
MPVLLVREPCDCPYDFVVLVAREATFTVQYTLLNKMSRYPAVTQRSDTVAMNVDEGTRCVACNWIAGVGAAVAAAVVKISSAAALAIVIAAAIVVIGTMGERITFEAHPYHAVDLVVRIDNDCAPPALVVPPSGDLYVFADF